MSHICIFTLPSSNFILNVENDAPMVGAISNGFISQMYCLIRLDLPTPENNRMENILLASRWAVYFHLERKEISFLWPHIIDRAIARVTNRTIYERRPQRTKYWRIPQYIIIINIAVNIILNSKKHAISHFWHESLGRPGRTIGERKIQVKFLDSINKNPPVTHCSTVTLLMLCCASRMLK